MDDNTRWQFELHARLSRFRRQVDRATERVQEWLALVNRPYIAFSTGKDSTCVLALVRQLRPETPAVYFDANCAFPESSHLLIQTPNTLKFPCDEPLLVTLARLGFNHPRLEHETMKTTVYGPIARLISQYKFDGVCYGLRADECRGRMLHARTRGAVFQYQRDNLWACQPIWDWSYMDVWAFIVSRDLLYCKTYDRMWGQPENDQRLSYWAGETNRSHGRYAWLKRFYPELWNRLVTAVPEVTTYG